MPARKTPSYTVEQMRARALHQHFFRRFFDNDTLSSGGDTTTSVVRALCFCSVPGLMVAFWLLPAYPGRNAWATAADRYFFVLFSFVAMGVVTTFEWEMLFPDRADFLILLPLPLKARELFVAKGRALLTMLAVFLAASNLFSLILFPAVSTGRRGNYFHTAAAHSASVLLAGIFASCCMLAIEGVSICVLPQGWQRRITPIVQALATTVLLVLLLLFPLFGAHMQTLLEGHAGFSIYIPPLWFLGLYEDLALGAAAPAGARLLGVIGMYATGCAAALALAAYPLAWARQKRRTLEGASQSRKPGGAWFSAPLHRRLLKRPQERAVFHFVSQTLLRNAHYQIYLAIYAGVGLALALASMVTLRVTPAHALVPALSNPGLHAVLPLLLFWLAVGLRVAFGFPVDMRARWIFPINLLRGGEHTRGTGVWVLLCCGMLTCAVVAALAVLGWRGSVLLEQMIWGAALSLLLADVFFFHTIRIPFTYPRLPGRANLPITLVLYAAAFPVFVLLTVYLELQSEQRVVILLRVLVGITALHLLLKLASRYTQPEALTGFAQDEDEDEFQTLGLSAY
jgi:hypothetical protein